MDITNRTASNEENRGLHNVNQRDLQRPSRVPTVRREPLSVSVNRWKRQSDGSVKNRVLGRFQVNLGANLSPKRPNHCIQTKRHSGHLRNRRVAGPDHRSSDADE